MRNDPSPDDPAQPPHSPDPTVASPTTTDESVKDHQRSTPASDPWSAQPPTYAPGFAALPKPDEPPTTQFPAVTLPSADVPPGFPPAAYTPAELPPPGYAPPNSPGWAPRRNRTRLIAVVTAVVSLLCAGGVTAVIFAQGLIQKAGASASPSTHRSSRATTGQPRAAAVPSTPTGKQVKVTYEITGDGPAQLVYLDDHGGHPQSLSPTALAWKVTSTITTPTVVSLSGLRLAGGDGTISCRISVDGKQVAKQSKFGGFAAVSCNQFILD